MKLLIHPGEEIPRWYGLAYRSWNTDEIVLYPVPINIFIRWYRSARIWVKIGPRYSKNEADAYRKGREDERRAARSL